MANFCHNCGAAVSPDAKFCSNCGAKLVEAGAPQPVAAPQPPVAAPQPPVINVPNVPPVPPAVPTPSGAPVIPQMQAPPMPVAPAGKSVVRVHYDGNWAAIDAKIRVMVNGQEIGKYSFLTPFDADAIVDGNRVVIRAKMWFRAADISFMIEPGQSYKVYLSYNRALGSIKLLLGKQ